MSREDTNAVQRTPLLTVDEAARYLNLSKSWVYKAAERGELPCFRVGTALRFSARALAAWINTQQHGPR